MYELICSNKLHRRWKQKRNLSFIKILHLPFGFMLYGNLRSSSMEETGSTEMKQSLSLTTDRYGENILMNSKIVNILQFTAWLQATMKLF